MASTDPAAQVFFFFISSLSSSLLLLLFFFFFSSFFFQFSSFNFSFCHPNFFSQDPSTESVNSFPSQGITLKGIKAFIKAHGGDDDFEDLTTLQVCEQFMRPATSSSSQSYCAAYKYNDRHVAHVAKATVYVAHVWKQKFLEVVQALEEWDSKQPKPTVFWLDLFSVNQHVALPVLPAGHAWWHTVFKEGVGKLKKTLVVMDVTVKGEIRLLGSAWCLWEMLATMNTGGELLLLVGKKTQKVLAENLVKDLAGMLARTCGAVDVAKAQATLKTDREGLLRAMEATVGFEQANRLVAKVVKVWLGEHAKLALDKLSKKERAHSTLPAQVARLLDEAGRLEEAAPLYKEALETSRTTLGGEHPETLEWVSDYAVLLRKTGKLAEATPLANEALEGFRKTLGEDHVKTLGALINLASVLHALGKLHEAEPLYSEALMGARHSLGDRHPNTLSVIHNWAVLFQDLGDLDEAAPLFEEALIGRVSTLGDAHQDTMATRMKLAALFHDRGDLFDAEQLFREALAAARKSLGDAHPGVVAYLSSLAALLEEHGQLDEAEQLYRESLSLARRILGNTHLETLQGMSALALLLENRGKVGEAEQLLKEGLAASKAVLGASHLVTKRFQKNLSELLES